MKFRWPSIKYAGEVAVTTAALIGWALVTAGIATIIPHYARALWFASTGLLLLSLCGWKFLGTIVTTGLYVLTRKIDA